MHQQTSIVITSIASPNKILKDVASECSNRGLKFIIIGDVPSPPTFDLPGSDFYNLKRQSSTGFSFVELCPKRHYARKNIGYLLSIQGGAEIIVETDDDNCPSPAFWSDRERIQSVPLVHKTGWVNAYAYFTDANIWPRGLPLDEVLSPSLSLAELENTQVDSPIQQGLADENPDVDAIYRLILPLPQKFRSDIRIGLGPGAWCPFNSQNTTWWPDAYPLLYLPAFCSFRMTDIWRSFVAQRIAWENNWTILFVSPTVWQERNVHKLMRDFEEEIPGHLHNRAICERLAALKLRPGIEHLGNNLLICYEELVRHEYVGKAELALVEAWLSDLSYLRSTPKLRSQSV